MATVVKFYEEFMSVNADPRVRHWTMMGSPGPTLVILAIYLLSVLVFIPAYMKNRKPYDLTKIIRCYNIFQIVSCCGTAYWMATAGWTTGEYSFGCQPADYSNNPNALRLLTGFYWFYFLKLAELIETVFFLLRKKHNQVTGLHIYHHASSFFLAYIGCKFIGGGMASLPLILNSFIHVIMYSYYYLSSFGPKWQRVLAPWKSKLTMIQMIQFTILIIHAMTALQPDCNVPRKVLLFWVPNVVVVYKMFYDFYTKSYNSNETKSKST